MTNTEEETRGDQESQSVPNVVIEYLNTIAGLRFPSSTESTDKGTSSRRVVVTNRAVAVPPIGAGSGERRNILFA